jgi:hypothetical protein
MGVLMTTITRQKTNERDCIYLASTIRGLSITSTRCLSNNNHNEKVNQHRHNKTKQVAQTKASPRQKEETDHGKDRKRNRFVRRNTHGKIVL